MSAGTITLHSKSPVETKKIGKRIGSKLRAGDVVALFGELGSGKTTLVKGIARGMGVLDEADVLSPSFVLIHEYDGREKIYHIDWYRLEEICGPDLRLAEECFHGDAVTLVEWAERGKAILPTDRIEIRLKHKGPSSRTIAVDARGKKHAAFLAALGKK